MRLRFLSALAAVLLSLAVAKPALADSVVFEGVSGNDYSYGLNTAPALLLVHGSSVTFTGLSGVTGATDAFPNIFNVSFTSDSVTYSLKRYILGVLSIDHLYSDIFTITSTASLGTVNYDIDAAFRDIDGKVQGPTGAAASVTPEPSTWALMATGIVGMVLVMRRRTAAII